MSILTFRGSHFEVGVQMGSTFREHVWAGCQDARQNPPPMSTAVCQEHLVAAMHLTQQVIPQVWEELRGIAVGAKVPLSDLVLSLYEDLWDSEDFETGCTDIAANRLATADGHLIMGHNNDEGVDAPPPSLLRLAPTGGPVVTGVALGGVGFSVGVNEHGLVLMGNQVSAKDVKPGIPRIFLVRAALNQPSLPTALDMLLHPLRSSSYNNVLGDMSGRVVNVEGSGTMDRTLVPTSQGILTHTNHYLHPEMQAIEGKGDMRSTTLREQRSCQMMSAMAGRHTVETFQQVLRDHTGYPRWRGAGVSIHAVLALSDGKVYLMVPPTEEKSSYLGKGTTVIRNFDRLVLTGITEEAYTALFKKVVMAANKAAKQAVQYEREGGGREADLSEYIALAKTFRDKWTRGETWGAVKRVVPVQRGYQVPQGKIDVGVVFNLAQFQKYVESGKAPRFLDESMFKVVTRTEAGVVTSGKGFDAIAQYGHSLAFIGALEVELREFNNKVVAPWRQALGETDYRR